MQTARLRSFPILLLFLITIASMPKAGHAQTVYRGSVDVFADTLTYADSSSANYNPALAAKLVRFEQDLTGDGWYVIFHGVARDPGINAAGVPIDRGASVRALKAQIYTDYNIHSDLKAVILFGHVPQPYSGDYEFDGDADHGGAWSCDAYYGDISDLDPNPNDATYPDYNWTDVSVNDVTADDPRNYNVPGDGKFDQSALPDKVKLEVGRIDFANMPAFSDTESELLAQYLDKDHAYRQGYIGALPQARVYDINDPPTITGRGVQNDFDAFYGATEIVPGLIWPWTGLPGSAPIPNPAAAGLTYFQSGNLIYQDLTQGSYQSNEISGDTYVADVFTRADSFPIWPNSVGGQNTSTVSTAQFAANDPHSMFYFMNGGDVASAGDWQIENDVLRAPLGTPTYGLECLWTNAESPTGALPALSFTSMAAGSEIGVGLAAAQAKNAGIELGLMGDPTIRLNPVMPPSGALTTPDATTANAVDITWDSAYPFDATSGLLGYLLFSSSSSTGPFQSANLLNVSGTNPTGIIPTAPTFTPSLTQTTGAGIAAGTYYVAVTYTGTNGGTSFETPPGPVEAITVNANNSKISCAGFTLPTGATSAKLYIAGAQGGTLYLNGTFSISGGDAQTFNKVIQPATSGTIAPVNTVCVDTTASTDAPTYYEVRAEYSQYEVATAYTGTSTTVYTNLSQGDFATYDPAGQYPTVQMVTPQNLEQANGGNFNLTNGVPYTAPASFTLSAEATAFGGKTIAKVDFYQGGSLIGTVTTPPVASGFAQGPWQYQVSNLAAGPYVFSAVATDSDGLISTSNTTRVYVYQPTTFYDFDAYYIANLSDYVFPATTGTGLNTGWWDNTGATGVTASYSSPSIGLNANAVGVMFDTTTPPATYTYTVGHAPIDTSVYYGATFSIYLFNTNTTTPLSVTVNAPLSGPNQQSQTVNLPADTLVAGTPFPWRQNVMHLTFPLSQPVGTSGELQTNFDGFSITAAAGATFEYDEATINLPGNLGPLRGDRQPTASFADFLLDTPVQSGYNFWASTDSTSVPPIDGVNLRVDAATPDSSISEVDFYLSGAFLGYGTIIPPTSGNVSYSNVLPLTPSAGNLTFGPTTIQATAIDGLGNPVSTAVIPVNIDNLYGLVTDISGNPIPNATISVVNSSGSNSTINDVSPSITGADGGSVVLYSDLSITTSSGGTTQVTSQARPFQFSDVGSTVTITGGTGFISGAYTVSSVNIGHVATLAGDAGAAGVTGGTGGIRLFGAANYSGGFAPGAYTLVASAGSSYETLQDAVTLSATSSLRHDFVLLPAGGPTLTATPGYRQVALSWTSVTNTVSYDVFRGTTPGGESTTPLITGVTGLTYIDSSPPLADGTTYYYTVSAVDANGNMGPLSNEASATTEPPAPTNLVATGGIGLINLTWTAAPGAATYNVYEGTTPGGESVTPIQTGVTAANYTVTGLTPNTRYYFEVTAVNLGGESPDSNEANALTGPAAPLTLTATGGQNSVLLNWNGSAGAATYNVYEGLTPGGESATPVATLISGTSFDVTGLADGTTYYFTVSAVNSLGAIGPSSNEASAITLPAAPTNLAAVAGVTQVSLTWTASVSATSYNVYEGLTPGGESGTPVATLISGTSFTVTGLGNGITYYFTVAAVNASGAGEYSNEANATTIPPAPTNLVATGGITQVQLSWTAASGAATYNVYQGTSAGSESATPVATLVSGTSFTVTGLANGTTYYFTVAGVNSVGGVSAQSNEASALTIPAAPTNLVATGGLRQVILTWTASSSATSYNVYEGTSAGAESVTPVATLVTSPSFTVTGLADGTTYYFVVRAVNASGVGLPSNEANATTIPPGPTNLVATGGITLAKLTWTASQAAISYNVYSGTSSGQESATPVAAGVTATSFTVTGLANNTKYYFTVRAVDTAGISAASNEASALTAPAAPSNLTATTNYGPVVLKWTGSAGATSYNVYLGQSTGGESKTPTATGITGTSYTVSGLTAGTTYFFTVTAVNAGAESAPSNEASVSTVPVQVFPAGWNFFSMPYDFSAYTFDQVFGPLNTGTASNPIPSNANRSHVDVWLPISLEYVVDPTAPADGFHLGQGYWVKLTSAATVALSAPLPSAATVSVGLTQGWNMIGVPSTTAVNLSTLTFTSPATGATELFAAAVADGFVRSTLYGYSGGSYTPVSTGGSLQPWQAYWIYVLGSTTMTIPTNIALNTSVRR